MAVLCNNSFNVSIGDVLHSTTSEYLVQSFVGQGTFGLVAKCRNIATDANVAIKIIKNKGKLINQTAAEISALLKLRRLDPDKSNIVLWYGHFIDKGNNCLVFEQLDKSLQNLMVERKWQPLYIKEIRPIVQQVAKALSYLKALQLLHGDIKLHNIMLVNHEVEPFRIKLIDFGLTYNASDTLPGHIFQTLPYRCPEVFLGLPLTVAIDMWSLGCVAAVLFLGALLFEGKHDYDIIMQIIQLLGPPPDQLLSAGLRTACFFEKRLDSSISVWKVKTLAQYYKETGNTAKDLRRHRIRSLEDLLKVHHVIHQISADYLAEMSDVLMFVDMLKRMFQFDGAQRITSHQLLEHQFITTSHIKPFYHLSHYSQSCHEIMKVFEIPGSRDAVPQCSQQVNISSAQPKHNVCSSPPTHPAVMAGQVQLQAAKENSGTTSNSKRKPELDDPNDPKKPWKQGKLKLSATSPARQTQTDLLTSSSAINTNPKARCNTTTRSSHPSADPQLHTLSPSTNARQDEILPSERTSEDAKKKIMEQSQRSNAH